ncbi:MAG: hypothetical protein LBC51_11705 [Treponema sp.]|jgi:hypothetical protein|nr:hypothetical protein [Treponema sp.]
MRQWSSKDAYIDNICVRITDIDAGINENRADPALKEAWNGNPLNKIPAEQALTGSIIVVDRR